MSSNKEFNSLPFLRVSKPFIYKYGLDAACLIEELIYWHHQIKKKKDFKLSNGFFFYEQYKIQYATGLSKHRQDKAINVLKELGILNISNRKQGIPPKTCYKIEVETYENITIGLSDEFMDRFNISRNKSLKNIKEKTKTKKRTSTKKGQSIRSPNKYRFKDITVPPYIDAIMTQEEIDRLLEQEEIQDTMNSDVYHIVKEFNIKDILIQESDDFESLAQVHQH